MVEKNYLSKLNSGNFMFLITVITILCFSITACESSASSSEAVQTEQKTVTESETKPNKGEVDHNQWEALLQLYVKENGKVDYEGFTKDRSKLEAYLASVAEIEFASLKNDDERNALHINSYNAFTILAVINEVYGKNSSVKNIKGFWDKKKYRLAQRDLTLDEIEKYSRDLDPRVHFAYNCASVSCPKLQRFAYTGAKLQERFEFVTKDFLADAERGMSIDRERKKIKISRLFLWYASDFKGNTSKSSQYWEYIKGQFSASAGVNFIRNKVSDDVKALLEDKKTDVSFLDYSWELNSIVPPAANLPKAPIN